MATDTKISWATHTFNPWIGCTKVSPGCANCYAETLMDNRLGKVNWGKGNPRSRTKERNWNQVQKWQREAVATGVRPRVFCASLGDWLDPEVPVEWLADLLNLVRETPDIDWLMLTKRPELWQERIASALDSMRGSKGMGYQPPETQHFIISWLNGEPPFNVWIGTSVEDQKRADDRIPMLLKIPAVIRFLSCEPLLGAVNLDIGQCDFHGRDYVHLDEDGFEFCNECAADGGSGELSFGHWLGNPETGIHWVIVGGESGPGARPMHSGWVRTLRDQCTAAGVSFHFKQWGEWARGDDRDEWPESKPLECVKPDGSVSWFAGDADGGSVNWSSNYEEGDEPISKATKERAGRLLDGYEWDEVPNVKGSHGGN
jgi:protein gp37